MEVKKSLLMPKTDFEMRGNLPIKEPKFLKYWEEIDLYNLMLKNNEGKEEYMLHDGPPYANGDMHCGHMLNKLLKDFIVRLKTMEGYYTPFIPGWDTHGLPIENVITKKGINRKTTPLPEFRKKCEEYAHEQVHRQMEQIKRLGVTGDFENRYMTLTHDYEAMQLEVFKDMALKGLIFKGLKPVYWSPSSESALAEAEIEYADVKSHAIFVAFKVNDGKGLLDNDTSFIIWTTTPWTMPANLAICLNPDYTYGVFNTNKGKFVFLKEFKDSLKEELGFETCELEKEFLGKDLEYITCKHPLYERDSVIILGDHVTNDAGTGCVHTAPGHGEDDFIVGKKYGLQPLCPVDSKGYMMKEAGEELVGLFYEEANEKVLEMLTNVGALIKDSPIVHSYPHDWRTKKPLIFRATPQWFCSIDPIREKLLEEISKVKWTPSWGEVRISNMIKDRGDWCISRQRAWGVPLPIFYAEDETPIIEKDVFDHVIKLVREYGSNVWFEREAKDLLPDGYTNPHSPNGKFTKETDIMDVWFDSGSSSVSVLKQRGLKFPADVYLEGSDQYRGWFNSSLIISTAVNGVSPYKHVVTHGFIQDANGDKMSKSKGNGVDPLKLMNVYGADVLRLWVANVDYQSDVRIGEPIIKQVSESYRKIRNTFKFLLGNLSNGEESKFDVTKDRQNTFETVDLFILARLEYVKNAVVKAMDEFDFAAAIMAITNFMSSDLSSFYLDLTKDILYCESKDSTRRLQVQTVIFDCVTTLNKLLAPILPFTMEEVYQNTPMEHKKSIQLESYPTITHEYDEKYLNEYALIYKLRSDVLKALEEARTNGLIGSAQEAHVKLHITNEYVKNAFLKFSDVEKERLFIVSKVELTDEKLSKVMETSEVEVTKHAGHKCERCWNYVDEIEEVEGVHLCHRCHEALGE
ncbi:MAG: isoleucine--tRNA ligase [Erysipelotrichales bacterium]|nr:isoleucine--tRNA ligase [Erysipelotrichales bacterium]